MRLPGAAGLFRVLPLLQPCPHRHQHSLARCRHPRLSVLDGDLVSGGGTHDFSSTAPPEAEQRAAKIASLKLEGAAAIERRERLAAALKDATQRRMCDSSDDSLFSDECEASDEQAELADEALLPSELLTADSVAVPALLEDNLLDLPNPRYASQNAAVLITAASSAVLVVAMSVAEFAPPGTSILGLLRRLPLSLWASYLRAVAAYPVAVKAALTGVTYVIGDMIAQVVQQQQQILQLQLAPRSLRDNLLRMDVWRYARAGLAGVVFLGEAS